MIEHLFARTVVNIYLSAKMSEDDIKDYVHSELAKVNKYSIEVS